MCETKIKKAIVALVLIPLVYLLGSIVHFSVSPTSIAYAAVCEPPIATRTISNDGKTIVEKQSGQQELNPGTSFSSCQDLNGSITYTRDGDTLEYYAGRTGCSNKITLAGAPADGATLQRGTYQGYVACAASGPAQPINVGVGANFDADGFATGGGDDDNSESPTSCAIDGIGWAICPIANFFGTIVDGMYGFVSDTFLAVRTDLVSNDSQTYKAWASFLGIANVFFVIIFLIIIFSQATGYGISNYGIKKMLPKLIVGVILINASYFICQAAVDISNILGYGFHSFFKNIGGNAQPISWATVISQLLAVGAAGAGLAAVSVGIGLTGLVIVLLTIAFIVLLLIIRQVLVVVCVVAAPIAFAAWLLPNTEKIFKLWWKVFYLMLIVFPVVSLVLGASALSSEIIRKSFTEEASSSFTGGGGGSF